jgi:ubiquinone/menaquinone biosynthesis C-methylase UbiE
MAGHGSGHKFDVTRLERLRDPERLRILSPDIIWSTLTDGITLDTLVDLGTGIGFFAIPFSRKIPQGIVYACDLRDEMLQYLKVAMQQEGRTNIRPVQTEEIKVPLDDGIADAVLMVNLHHELDFPDQTLQECHRLLRHGGKVAIVDWKPEPTPKGPPLEARVALETVRTQLQDAGFQNVTVHAVLPHHYVLTGLKRAI